MLYVNVCTIFKSCATLKTYSHHYICIFLHFSNDNALAIRAA